MTDPKSGFEEITEDFVQEDVERRRAPRGLLPGLTIRLGGAGGMEHTLDVVEASRKSMFLSSETPERFPAGQVLDAELAYQERRLSCRVRIVRAENEPRKGVAVVLHEATPHTEAVLREILAAAEIAAGP